jgi:hypothetical protein
MARGLPSRLPSFLTSSSARFVRSLVVSRSHARWPLADVQPTGVGPKSPRAGDPAVVAGYWLEPKDGKGLSVVVFESEDAARQAAERVPDRVPREVSLESVETREVVAHI